MATSTAPQRLLLGPLAADPLYQVGSWLLNSIGQPATIASLNNALVTLFQTNKLEYTQYQYDNGSLVFPVTPKSGERIKITKLVLSLQGAFPLVISRLTQSVVQVALKYNDRYFSLYGGFPSSHPHDARFNTRGWSITWNDLFGTYYYTKLLTSPDDLLRITVILNKILSCKEQELPADTLKTFIARCLGSSLLISPEGLENYNFIVPEVTPNYPLAGLLRVVRSHIISEAISYFKLNSLFMAKEYLVPLDSQSNEVKVGMAALTISRRVASHGVQWRKVPLAQRLKWQAQLTTLALHTGFGTGLTGGVLDFMILNDNESVLLLREPANDYMVTISDLIPTAWPISSRIIPPSFNELVVSGLTSISKTIPGTNYLAEAVLNSLGEPATITPGTAPAPVLVRLGVGPTGWAELAAVLAAGTQEIIVTGGHYAIYFPRDGEVVLPALLNKNNEEFQQIIRYILHYNNVTINSEEFKPVGIFPPTSEVAATFNLVPTLSYELPGVWYVCAARSPELANIIIKPAGLLADA